MLYNHTNQPNGIPMPLLMGYTPSSRIQETNETTPIIYDPVSQTVYDMRVVGTRCLQTSNTNKKLPNGTKYIAADDKNAIDDQKLVD